MKASGCVLLGWMCVVAGCAHWQGANVDLSTPESTVVGFTKAAAKGNAKVAQSYFLPGGVDDQDIAETLTAKPGTPRYAGRVMLEAIDPSRPIIVRSQRETEHGLQVIWQVTLGKAFEIEGQKVEAGTAYDFDATLKKTAEGWLIDNF